MRHRIVLPVLAALFTLLAAPPLTPQRSLRTAAQRFALDLDACAQAHAAGKPGKCQLFGKIQFVQSFPDVKVQVVTAFPDIKVQIVNAFPDKPGKWQKVSSFPDYKVQIVNSFPDYKIQYVQSFPGCN